MVYVILVAETRYAVIRLWFLEASIRVVGEGGGEDFFVFYSRVFESCVVGPAFPLPAITYSMLLQDLDTDPFIART